MLSYLLIFILLQLKNRIHCHSKLPQKKIFALSEDEKNARRRLLQEFMLDACQLSSQMKPERRSILAKFLGIGLDSNGEIIESDEEDNSSGKGHDRARTLSSSGFINSVLAGVEPDWHSMGSNDGLGTIGSPNRLELLEKKFKEGKLSAAEYSALRQREATGAKMTLETKEWEDRHHQLPR